MFILTKKVLKFPYQISKNQELTIQQLRRKKKTHKYPQLMYGEQIPEKQTRNSSVKFSLLNQEE